MALDLEFLKKEYEEALRQSSGSGEFWAPKEGMNLIRLLPPKEGKKVFYKKIGVHFGLLGSKMEFCPKESLDQRCPICELVDKLYKMNTPGAVELVGKLKVKRRCVLNVLPLDTENISVLPYVAPITVYKDILGIIMIPDYGDITDPKSGRNVVIEKIIPGGQKIQTEYKVIPKPDRTSIKDISLLSKIIDLDEFVKSKVKSYDVLAQALLGEDNDVEELDDLVDKYLKYKDSDFNFGKNRDTKETKEVEEEKKGIDEKKKEEGIDEKKKEEGIDEKKKEEGKDTSDIENRIKSLFGDRK